MSNSNDVTNLDYMVVSGDAEEDFEVSVRSLINAGYVPHGGLSVVQYGDVRAFYQAMIRWRVGAPPMPIIGNDHYPYKRRIND